MKDLLVSAEIADDIDESQFFEDAESEAVEQLGEMPFYVTLTSGEHEYVGWMVHMEEGKASQPGRKTLSFRIICRTQDVAGLIRHRHAMETVIIMDHGSEVASYDVSRHEVTKFGIAQDNPLDTSIYAAYIQFE